MKHCIKNKKILNYFLMFGNIPEDEKYWDRNYVYTGQIIIGIIFSPIMTIGWILRKILF